jgi:hypothetical protein
MGAVADLDHQSVEIDDRIERFQRPALPGHHLVADLIDDLRQRLAADLGADRGGQVVLDVTQRHPAGVQRDDHLIETAETTRSLRHQRR